MFIDCGFKDAKEASYYGIRPGTHVTFDAGFEKGRNGFVFSKSLDDRVGCALLCLIAEEFDGKSCELNLVATVREETGLMGAGTSAFAIEPELAIAVDVSMASGTPDVSEENVPVKFRGGAVLGVLEGSGRGLIMEDKLVNWIEGIAKKRKIKLQFEAIERGATDASRMQYVRSGLLTASLLAPARYLHSPCEMVCLEDVMEVKRLALEITKEFKDYK
jgi:endoglucanase